MIGIEIDFKESGSYYFSIEADLFNPVFGFIMNQTFSTYLTRSDLNKIEHNIDTEIAKCLDQKSYFETRRKPFGRMKTIEFTENKYILNLSERKHSYFYDLIMLKQSFLKTPEDEISGKLLKAG